MTKIPFHVFESSETACAQLAAELAQLIHDRAVLGRHVVLGLAAGNSTRPLYNELVYLHREEGLSLKNVVTFNMEEYVGSTAANPNSCRAFMNRHLFNHVDIFPENIHFPSASSDTDLQGVCACYEQELKKRGGMDFLIARICREGHVGFNPAFAPIDSRTRSVPLNEGMRHMFAPFFGGIEKVPLNAVTMGCATILSSRRVALLAWGPKKSRIVRKVVEGNISPESCASYLQTHPRASFVLDEQAASLLGK